MSILGLDQNGEQAKAIATGLKGLRMGDIIEIPLEDRLERKIINDKKKEMNRSK